MKTLKFLPTLLLCAFAFYSCSEKVQEAKNTYNAISNLTEAAENIEKSVELSEKKREERIKKGDTLAMNYKELQVYLPAEISGYTKEGEPTGSTMNMTGMSYSVGEQTYSNGDNYIKVNIMDYNGAYGMYAGAVAIYGAGFSMEDDEQKMQGIDLGMEDVKGWEVLMKKENRASLVVGIGERFLVSIEANNQKDTEKVKSVVKSLQLDKLAKL